MSDGGKGSAPRPYSVANDEWMKRWDAIFSRDLQDEDKSENKPVTEQKLDDTQ